MSIQLVNDYDDIPSVQRPECPDIPQALANKQERHFKSAREWHNVAIERHSIQSWNSENNFPIEQQKNE